MNQTEPLNQQWLIDWPYRVCLPYGMDLLQLARWVNVAIEGGATPQFDIIVGEKSHMWRGSDPIDLFGEIQTRCVNYSLSSSYVYCKSLDSVMFFDMHGRYSFFAASLQLLQNLYPFSREILWENFALLQEEDDDLPLAQVFYAIQSV